ncbi:MAG: protein kinase, partial [Acidobacteriota bacterium]
FAREAQVLARLSHPNLVSIHDYGQDGPLGWLVMEYVDGSSLRDLIRAGKLEPSEALALIPKICDALQYAHDQGVVHRDVKPANILVGQDGVVKIADFGLAKLTGIPASLVSLTGSREVLGTFRYMAPEQLERPLEVDHRADIYSLGVVFYEMLTGEIPMGRFDPPSAHSAATPRVDDVVLRALAREPNRRYQRAAEVKSDLATVDLADRPSEAAAPARLSIQAVTSAALAGLGLIPFTLSAAALASGATGDDEAGEAAASFVGCFGFAVMVVGSAVGFWALSRIRQAWPRLYGVGAAVFGAWTAIFIFLNGALLGSLPLADPGAGCLTFLLFGAEIVFLVRYRRRFLNRCA